MIKGSQSSHKPSINSNDLQLTHSELLSIVKAVTAVNGGRLEWDERYLKYANELPIKVERKDGVIVVTTP